MSAIADEITRLRAAVDQAEAAVAAAGTGTAWERAQSDLRASRWELEQARRRKAEEAAAAATREAGLKRVGPLLDERAQQLEAAAANVGEALELAQAAIVGLIESAQAYDREVSAAAAWLHGENVTLPAGSDRDAIGGTADRALVGFGAGRFFGRVERGSFSTAAMVVWLAQRIQIGLFGLNAGVQLPVPHQVGDLVKDLPAVAPRA